MKKHTKRPRKPNKQEISDLISYAFDKYPFDFTLEETKGFISGETYIAVFDDYISDEPGGKGKLMMVVWPNSHYYDTFTWNINDNMVHHEKLPDNDN
jgi:hypothetical protein